MVTIELYWNDLSVEKKRFIADIMQRDVDDVPKLTNWDIFPMTTFEIEEVEDE